MKLVRESLYEFHKTGDPLTSLGLGYEGGVYALFDSLGISRDRYKVEGNKTIFYGGLDLRDRILDKLPNGLILGGSLDLSVCTSLASLPDGLTVGGSLYLRGCTSLASLPDGLTVGGYLDLSGCTSLASLPDGLTVSSLDLSGCTLLTSLSDDLDVKAKIYVNKNQTKLINWIKSSKFKIN